MTPLTLAEIAAGEAECQQTLPPLTPEAIDADLTLSDEDRARLYDLLFEYQGDEDDEGCPW